MPTEEARYVYINYAWDSVQWKSHSHIEKAHSSWWSLSVAPKGIDSVTERRGCYRSTMKLEDMQKEITTHPELRNANNILEYFINSHGLAFLFNPKYLL